MARASVRTGDEFEKTIIKHFDRLTGRFGRWEIWADWITMSAIAISNTVDTVHRDERERTYRNIQGKYTTSEMQIMAEMLGLIVEGLDRNPDQDLLGDLFMRLELGNDHAGQFFTPYSICKAMAALTCPNLAGQIQEKGWISVNDPTCGAGALLVALANECVRQDINYQQTVLFTGQDIDYTVGMMCYIQLSLLGCPGYIAIGDTIAHPTTAIDKRGLIPKDEGNVWYTPMYFRDVWNWRRVWEQVQLLCATKKDLEPHSVKNSIRPEIRKTFAESENGQLTLF